MVKLDWPRNVLINVNFPDVPHDEVTGIQVARQGRRKIGDMLNSGIDPRGHPYIWVGTERDEDPSFRGSDLEPSMPAPSRSRRSASI